MFFNKINCVSIQVHKLNGVLWSLNICIPAPDATFRGEITYWIECTIYNTDVFLAQRFASAEDANVASGEFNRQMPATPELAGQQRLAKKTRAAA